MTTLTYSGRLVVEKCWCGIGHAIPQSLADEAARAGTTVYCPLGHGWVIKGSENEKLKQDLKWYKDRAAAETARADGAEASRRAWKGQATKARNRLVEGTCPFCGKYLVDLDLHMTRKHPDEHVRELTEEDATS